MFSAADRAALPAYAPAQGCDDRLNAYCDKNCPHATTHGALLARKAASAIGPAPAWRCFARSALMPDAERYKDGKEYCTRDSQLRLELAKCLADGPPPPPPPLEPEMVVEVIEPSGETVLKTPPPPMPKPPPRSPPVEEWIDGPKPLVQIRAKKISGVKPPPPPGPAPHYAHDAALMMLSPRIAVPSLDACSVELASAATFLAVSMYTDACAAAAAAPAAATASAATASTRIHRRAAGASRARARSPLVEAHAKPAPRRAGTPARRATSRRRVARTACAAR